MTKLQKFVQFAKVDAVKREVWGIVTAEYPDKDDEVCDYAKTKPYYEAVIREMGKATDGKNFFPLREMHQLDAVGKCIGFEFRDDSKEIFMGFKVVDDDAWRKVEENVYTGFSQGGRKVGDDTEDPIFKGCMRYVANPSEASLVDNPCLGVAHFAYIKADGAMEIRKFSKVIPIRSSQAQLEELRQEIELLKASQIGKSGKTKRKGGKDLPSSDFAYVGDKEDPSTWKLPIHDAAHCRNALARFNQTKGIPAGEKDKVHARIVAACKKFGIDVDKEKEKVVALYGDLRKRLRIFVNRAARKGDVGHTLSFLDSELAKLQRGALAKGMYEVSFAAQVVENLASLFFQVKNEQEWEMDTDSELPERLADSVDGLLEVLVLMLQEESTELRQHIESRIA